MTTPPEPGETMAAWDHMVYKAVTDLLDELYPRSAFGTLGNLRQLLAENQRLALAEQRARDSEAAHLLHAKDNITLCQKLAHAEQALVDAGHHEDQLRAENAALRRLLKDNYVSWAAAGGPNECTHGRAEGIPCPACDRQLVSDPDTLVHARPDGTAPTSSESPISARSAPLASEPTVAAGDSEQAT